MKSMSSGWGFFRQNKASKSMGCLDGVCCQMRSNVRECILHLRLARNTFNVSLEIETLSLQILWRQSSLAVDLYQYFIPEPCEGLVDFERLVNPSLSHKSTLNHIR